MASTSEDEGAIADVFQDIRASWPECFITLEPIAPIGADGKPLSPAQYSLDLLNQLLNLLLKHEKKHSRVILAAAISDARLRRLRAHPTHPDRQLTEDDVYKANLILDDQSRAQRPRVPKDAATVGTASTKISSLQSTPAATASPTNILQPTAVQHGTRQQGSGPTGNRLAKMSGCEFVEHRFWPAPDINLPRHWLENVGAAAEELRSEFQGNFRPKAIRDAVTESIHARHNAPGEIQHNVPYVIRADLIKAATSLRARERIQQSQSPSLPMSYHVAARVNGENSSAIPSTPRTAAHSAGVSYAGKGKGPARASLSSGEGLSAPYRPFASSNGWRSDVTRPAGDTTAPVYVGSHVSPATPSSNAAKEGISSPDAGFASFNSPVQNPGLRSTAQYSGMQALTNPRSMQNVTELSYSSRDSQMAVDYDTTSQVDLEMPDLLYVSAVPYTALLQTSHPEDPQDMSGIELTQVSNAPRDVKNHIVSAGISAVMQPEVAAQASESTLGELTRVSSYGPTTHKVPGPFFKNVVSEQQEANVHADLSVARDEEQGVNQPSYTSAAQGPAHDNGSVSQSLNFMTQPLAEIAEREHGNGPPASELARREETSPLVSICKLQRIYEIIETNKMSSSAVWYKKRMGDPYEQSHARGIVRKPAGIFASRSVGVQYHPSHADSKWDRFLIPCLNTRHFGTFECFIQIRAYLREFMKNKNTPFQRSQKMNKHQYSRGILGKQNNAMRPLPPNLQHGESVLCRQRPTSCRFPWRKQANSNILPEAKQQPMPLDFRFPIAPAVRQARSADDKQQMKLIREGLAEPECAMTGLVAVTADRMLFEKDLQRAILWLRSHGKGLIKVKQPRTEIARRVFGVSSSTSNLPANRIPPFQRFAGVVICRWSDYCRGKHTIKRLASSTNDPGDAEGL